MSADLERRHAPRLPAELESAVLRYLGLDPAAPATHALALVARRFDLDPLLGEVAVIRSGDRTRVYVTRDGMLRIAHRSGQLDGIVVDELREGDAGWAATVSVFRKDCAHPFTYSAGCGRGEPQARAGNGAEMALARAERRALRRAFAIPTDDVDDVEMAAVDDRSPPSGFATHEDARAEIQRVRLLDEEAGCAAWVAAQAFPWPWSRAACDAIAEHAERVLVEQTGG